MDGMDIRKAVWLVGLLDKNECGVLQEGLGLLGLSVHNNKILNSLFIIVHPLCSSSSWRDPKYARRIGGYMYIERATIIGAN